MKYIACLALLPGYLFSIPEEDLCPKVSYPATVWYSDRNEFYVMFESNIIIIDAWHYAEIDD